jgi:hypothetical protein
VNRAITWFLIFTELIVAERDYWNMSGPTAKELAELFDRPRRGTAEKRHGEFLIKLAQLKGLLNELAKELSTEDLINKAIRDTIKLVADEMKGR